MRDINAQRRLVVDLSSQEIWDKMRQVQPVNVSTERWDKRLENPALGDMLEAGYGTCE